MGQAIRKVVTAQSVLGFVLNVAMLGFSINVSAGSLGLLLAGTRTNPDPGADVRRARYYRRFCAHDFVSSPRPLAA